MENTYPMIIRTMNIIPRNFIIGGNMNGNSSYLAGESTYSISDYTKIKANILLLEAEPNDPSYSYDAYMNIPLINYLLVVIHLKVNILAI